MTTKTVTLIAGMGLAESVGHGCSLAWWGWWRHAQCLQLLLRFLDALHRPVLRFLGLLHERLPQIPMLERAQHRLKHAAAATAGLGAWAAVAIPAAAWVLP